MEHHHCVAWDESSRKPPLQLQRQALSTHEAWIEHCVAHLRVILERHLCNGCRVRTPLSLELSEQRLPVIELIQQGVQQQAVLEGCVHTLAVEGHDGMGSITEQQHAAGHVPRYGMHGAQLTCGVAP